MTNTLKAIGYVIAGLAVGLLVSAVMHTPTSGGVYNQVQKYFPQGLGAGSTNQFSVDTSGVLTVPYVIVSGSVNSTSTNNSATYNVTDFATYSLISDNLAVTSSTLTLPASSTITSWLSATVGAQRTIRIANATTTAGTVLTLAGNTGMFLTVASSSPKIYPNRTASLTCVRQASSDVACDLTGI